MSSRAIVAAWIVAFALWGLVWGVASMPALNPNPSSGASGLGRAFASASLPSEKVDVIELSQGGTPLWSGRKLDGAWSQVQPIEFELEGLFVEEFIDRVRTLEVLETPAAGAPILAADAPRLRLGWKDGSVEIALGPRLPGGCAWVAIGAPGAPAQVARATLHDALLARDLKQWRQMRLFTRADVECDRIVSHSAAADGSMQRLEIERRGRSWWLVSPVATRADREAVERWLDALGRARANGPVVDKPRALGPFGLDAPHVALEISSHTRRLSADGSIEQIPRTERLEIGAAVREGASERFARLGAHPDAIVEVDAASVAACVPPALSLVDSTASGARGADIRAIVLEPVDAGRVRLERAGAVWTLASDGKTRAANPSAIDTLLSRLCTDRATAIAQGAAPADLFIGRVILEGFDGRELAALRVSREREGGRYGVDDGSGILRIYPAASAFLLEVEDYEDRAGALAPLAPPVPLPR